MRLALAIAMVVGSAAAASADSSREDEAREHFRRGMASYHLLEFESAIAEFKKAYQLTQAPGLLFNLAQAARLNNDPKSAVLYYRSYLRLVPRASNREDVERLIVWCEDALRGNPDASREIVSVNGMLPTSDGFMEAKPPQLIESSNDGARRSRRRLAIGGVITASLGLAALAGAVVLGVRADQAEVDLSRASRDEDRWSARHDQLYLEGQREAAAATAMYVVGGASLATGLVLAILAARKGATRLEPTLARRSPVALAWEF